MRFGGVFGASDGRPLGLGGGLAAGLLAGGLLGALLLLVAEFTVLFQVHSAATGVLVKSVSAGPHHSYAMAVIAACAALMALAIWRAASRPALLGLGVLGIAALLIALLGDLPDASATGLLPNNSLANSTPSAGFYLETLGAVMLLLSSVWGFLLIGSPRSRASTGSPRSGGSRGEG